MTSFSSLFFLAILSPSFLFLSLRYMSACFLSTRWTVDIASSVPPSPEPGGPAKKSDFRRRKLKTESRRGSMPRV